MNTPPWLIFCTLSICGSLCSPPPTTKGNILDEVRSGLIYVCMDKYLEGSWILDPFINVMVVVFPLGSVTTGQISGTMHEFPLFCGP